MSGDITGSLNLDLNRTTQTMNCDCSNIFSLTHTQGTLEKNVSLSKINCQYLFTRRGFCMVSRDPQWVGYEHVLLFQSGQSVVSPFLCLGLIVIVVFSSTVAKKLPALFRIRSTSLTFSSWDRCCPELTPRVSRCGVMSNLHANHGTMCDSVPSELQTESGELKEQVNVTFIV